jgi:hypothetical protein
MELILERLGDIYKILYAPFMIELIIVAETIGVYLSDKIFDITIK